MTNNLSTQFPKPPKLQPISSTRFKIWHTASFVLTIAGLALMGTGGWMFYQQQVEANKPPPARILEVSIADLTTITPTSLPTPMPVKSTATSKPVSHIAVDTISPAVTPTLEPISTSKPISSLIPETATPVSANALEAEPTTDDVLSLADNPLLVAEDENKLENVETQPNTENSETTSNFSVSTNVSLTRIVAESINMDAEIVEVGWEEIMQNGVLANVWKVADYAAGWHRNSTLPGQNGNIVLSAHHNIKGEVFRYTVDLEPGDIITIYDEAQSYDYVVEDKFIVKDKGEPEGVRLENAKWIGPFNEERLTLVTCWPYNNNTHRLIVIAKPLG